MQTNLSEIEPTAKNEAVHILIVDDHAETLYIYVAVLQRNGYHVTIVDNAKAGLQHLSTVGASLLLTDINMEDMDGLELITRAKKIVPDLGIIAMSGGGVFPPDFCLKMANKIGAATTLTKPFSMDELLSAVKGVLTASRRL